MKSILSVLLSVCMVLLLLVNPVKAQETRLLDAELIRSRIERLESVNVKSKSPTVQDLYKQTLLRLYDDYGRALNQDLVDLQNILAAAGESKRDGQSQIAQQIRRITEERDITIEKIKTLRSNIASDTTSTDLQEPRTEAVGQPQIRAASYAEATKVSSPANGVSVEQPTTSRSAVNLPLLANVASTSSSTASTLGANTADNNVGANVDWETRTAGCPAKVTASTSAIIRVTHINDLLVNFDTGEKLEYVLRAKGTPVSAVPKENPFALQSGSLAQSINTVDDALAMLTRIRAAVLSNPNISPAGEGGSSIPLRVSYNAAKALPDVQNILVRYSQNPQDPIFTDPRVAGNAVFQWIKLIEGSHSYDFTAVLEPDMNYEFTVTEKWKGKPTAQGTLKWYCGERDIFTLSIGPVISTLPMRTYSHQKALVPPGSSTTQDILVVENTRNVSVLGAALLNYHFPHIKGMPRTMGFALSAGPVYTLGSTPEVSALGLFVGPTIHLNRSLFITPGLHIGQFADFPAGFAPGTVIPNQFGELNPVKRNTAHFAIGITYRTNSFKKSSTAAGTASNAASAGGSQGQPASGNKNTPGSTGTGQPNP